MRQLPPGTRTDVDARRAQVDLFLALGRIQAVVQRRTAELFEAEGLGQITPAQSNVLMVVFQARRPITAREIARTLGVAEPTVSRFIKALERDGWVRRAPDPGDKRARLIEATAKARAALPRFIHMANLLMDQAFGGLEPAGMRGLCEGVSRIVANLSPDEG
ncbi:MAG: MarR family transcriptional regulator [Myxococcales bacterium]|nr:MarR family transcriptional regulator [Myxococcales bacterium]MCB9525291.1 MarR family transcriptional regulator [Myxococcales bacterium]